MKDATLVHPVFTIGHSNQTLEHFIALLQEHGITALADIRSKPYSRYVPHFSRDALKAGVEAAGIAYVFLGNELGARPDDPGCYIDGKVNYEKLAQRPAFAEGIGRLQEGRQKFRISLMCAEKDPVNCHRAHLVASALSQQGVAVLHIHADGHLESHAELLQRQAPDKDDGSHREPDLFR